jgi:hypothetical protein
MGAGGLPKGKKSKEILTTSLCFEVLNEKVLKKDKLWLKLLVSR